MNTTMIALAMASIMIIVGLFLRANVKPLRKMLVPTCVIAGVLGLIFMNLVACRLLHAPSHFLFSLYFLHWM